MIMIKVNDHVNQCYSNSDGDVIRVLIADHLGKGQKVSVSFDKIDSLSASFVNSAFIDLLEIYTFDTIRRLLGFADSSKSINDLIKKRFSFEVNERSRLFNV
ncbi:STAS-like domain-containing protein [Paenibacillus alba]|uniref:STAS-like domain-containing protein n=1 Tax=Paenibacillus alba TaxID=1197127 RepID=A0ABU6FYA5_9BACL|nr:STAS-like domain-containing protein [Paenibacillus alba]MEC0225534.1 STAS-like domain-containing protein [Paenibacillus alba]